MARPWRSGSCARSAALGFEGEPEHGALLRLGFGDDPREGSDDDVEPRRDVVGASSGSSDSAAVSGWAAASSARWFGKYRYAVVREIDAASAASSTVGA